MQSSSTKRDGARRSTVLRNPSARSIPCKHASLLPFRVSYSCKKFYNLGRCEHQRRGTQLKESRFKKKFLTAVKQLQFEAIFQRTSYDYLKNILRTSYVLRMKFI
jgi:hypothetical protein